MVEQNFSGYNNAFKFNGKEQDPETGMYYYGARYYDPKMSLFVSVDPLAEQFVGWSPYHYVHNNPINLIDPTGMAAENADGGIKDWWKRVKAVFTGDSDRPNAPQYADDGSTMMEEMTIDRRPSFMQRLKRSFSREKLKSDWKRIKENTGWNHLKGWSDQYKFDLTGGLGGYQIWGQSSYDTGGADIEGKIKTIQATDMGNVGAGGAALDGAKLFFRIADGVQTVNSATSAGVSIKNDENVQKVMTKINRTLLKDIGGESRRIQITPHQDSLLNDFRTEKGAKFRDSLQGIFNFKAYK